MHALLMIVNVHPCTAMWKGVLFVCLFLLVSADEKDAKKPQFVIPSTFEGDPHVFFTESFSSPDSFAQRYRLKRCRITRHATAPTPL